MCLKSTNIRWLLTRSVRIKSTKGRGESVRIANTYLNISPFDLSGLGCLAIFTCIIYISRSRSEDGARSFPSSFHGQVPRRSRNFANKNFFFLFLLRNYISSKNFENRMESLHFGKWNVDGEFILSSFSYHSFFFLHWRFKVAILKNTIYIIKRLKLKSIGEYNENINFLANLKTRNAEDPLLSGKKGEP